MRLMRRRLLAPTLIVILLAGSIITIYYGIINGPTAGPGVLISLSLYDVDVKKGMIIDSTSILDDPNILMYLEVNAITPPGFRWVDDIVSVFKDTIKAKSEIYIRSEELQEIAKGWISVYESRRGDPEKTYSGLVIRLLIINATSKEIIFEAYDSISYKPSEIAKGKAVKVDLSSLRGSHKYVNVEHDYVRWYKELRAKPEKAALNGCLVRIYRELVVEVKPEDIQSKLPKEYFNNFNGRLYMKTPVLIADNVNSHSGTVGVSINIGARSEKVGVYPAFTSGKILDEIMKGVAPNVTLWKGSGFTWGGSSYYYYKEEHVRPLESKWMWIWARPIYRAYKVYKYDFCSGREYFGDDVENVITDVLTYDTTIIGNADLGLPHSELMNAFFSGTTMIRPYISGTSLDDGDLDPGEGVSTLTVFKYISSYIGKCIASLELGIPAGAIAALGICKLLGLDAPACEAAITFVSTFMPSISAERSTVFVDGILKNFGDDPDIPNDYNVPEIVYVAVSKYRYKVDPQWWCFWCSPCYYNIPAGIYFKLD